MTKKEQNKARKFVLEHQFIAGVVERLLDAGWLDHEKIADTIASELIDNPYGVNPNKDLISKAKNK